MPILHWIPFPSVCSQSSVSRLQTPQNVLEFVPQMSDHRMAALLLAPF